MNPIIAVEKRFLKGLLGVYKRRKKGLLYVAFSSTFKKLIKLRIFLSVQIHWLKKRRIYGIPSTKPISMTSS